VSLPKALSSAAAHALLPSRASPLMDMSAHAADSDLDDIWYYVATNSGSARLPTVDRLYHGRFLLLATYPNIGRRERDCARPTELSVVSASSYIGFRRRRAYFAVLRVPEIEALFGTSLAQPPQRFPTPPQLGYNNTLGGGGSSRVAGKPQSRI